MVAAAFSVAPAGSFAAPPGPPPGAISPSDATLTRQERQQFAEARKKAMSDPAVTAARQARIAAQEEYQSAMKTALLEQDATLGPVLEKIRRPAPGKTMPPAPKPPAPPAAPEASGQTPPPPPAASPKPPEKGAETNGGLGLLTPQERKQLRAATEAVRDKPPVKQASAKVREAEQQFRETMKAAILKADPSVAPVVAKVEAALKERRQGMRPRAGKGDAPQPPPPSPDGAPKPGEEPPPSTP